MATFLEMRQASGTTFYSITEPNDLELLRYWRTIDCGCRAYMNARAATLPRIKEMLPRLSVVATPISVVGNTIYKVVG